MVLSFKSFKALLNLRSYDSIIFRVNFDCDHCFHFHFTFKSLLDWEQLIRSIPVCLMARDEDPPDHVQALSPHYCFLLAFIQINYVLPYLFLSSLPKPPSNCAAVQSQYQLRSSNFPFRVLLLQEWQLEFCYSSVLFWQYFGKTLNESWQPCFSTLAFPLALIFLWWNNSPDAVTASNLTHILFSSA